MRVTHALVEVAAALMNDASGQHWGYELSKSSGVRSGVMYPVLHACSSKAGSPMAGKFRRGQVRAVARHVGTTN